MNIKILEMKMTTYKFLASDSASAMEEVVKKLGPDRQLDNIHHKKRKYGGN